MDMDWWPAIFSGSIKFDSISEIVRVLFFFFFFFIKSFDLIYCVIWSNPKHMHGAGAIGACVALQWTEAG